MGQTVSSIVKNHFQGQEPPCFVSMGIVMLQEIHLPSRLVEYDVPGGAGLYATFGARLFKPGARAKDVGYLLVVGRDFPYPLFAKIKSWNITLDVHYNGEEPCTRARVEYRMSNIFRKIQTYITPPLEPTALNLDKSILLKTKSFHLLGRPSEVRKLVLNILRMRAEVGMERPLIVWEPDAAGCHPDNLEHHFNMFLLVDVFSPSYEALYCLTTEPRDRIPFTRQLVQQQVTQFLDVGVGAILKDMVVVRCGHRGCYYWRDKDDNGWVRPVFTHGHPKFIDPTGSGSAFLGAFTVGLLETDHLRAACLRGQVAASFAVEQYGPPEKSRRYKLIEHPYRLTRKELWNDNDPISRLENFARETRNDFV